VAALGDKRAREFLCYGTRTGKLAYLAPSGRPLVAPVWFIVEDDNLVFNTGSQNGLPDSPSAASVISAITRAIGAASASTAWDRVSRNS
jgi:hypothetical protein